MPVSQITILQKVLHPRPLTMKNSSQSTHKQDPPEDDKNNYTPRTQSSANVKVRVNHGTETQKKAETRFQCSRACTRNPEIFVPVACLVAFELGSLAQIKLG